MNDRVESGDYPEASSPTCEIDSSERIDLLSKFTAKENDAPEASEAETASSEIFTPEQAERLRSIEVLQEHWNESDRSQRQGALVQLESELATMQGRPAVDVHFEQMPPGNFGYYDGDIHIQASDVEATSPQEAINTIAHEGRHAYQDFCMENPGHHNDPKELELWAENAQNYLRPGDMSNGNIITQEMYMNQPLEADAWPYGNEVARVVGTERPGEVKA